MAIMKKLILSEEWEKGEAFRQSSLKYMREHPYSPEHWEEQKRKNDEIRRQNIDGQMPRLIVIPDVHGRTFWKKALDSDLPVVFLGDYLDPYPDEGITPEDALQNFRDIIAFARENPDRVTLLLGNHTLHYIGLSADAARFDYDNSREIYSLIRDNKPLFQFAFRWGDTLLTHAGVNSFWLESHDIADDIEAIEKHLNRNWEISDRFLDDPLYLGCLKDDRGEIGRSRGGRYLVGSPDWNDLRDMFDSSCLQGYIQVFGHTQLCKTGAVFAYDNWICCDSREAFVWNGKELSVFQPDLA